MGLFDFARNVGVQLFSQEEDAADSIRAHIESDNPGIKKLEVVFREGTVEISGEAESGSALQKAILMAGNVRGVGAVKVRSGLSPATEESVAFYTIKHGDTLAELAKLYYGDAAEYSRILEANREVIKDADRIYIGQKIRIPLG